MIRLLADASLPALHSCFADFQVETYQHEEDLKTKLDNHDILLCRSTLKVNARLLEKSSIKLLATASSGMNHLDLDWLRQRQIPCLSAKGANAPAVADYVCMVLAWLKTQQNWWGKTAGLIGYGAVGQQVATRLADLGFALKIYDPLLGKRTGYRQYQLSDLHDCDLVCIHCNYHQTPPFPSHHLIDVAFLQHFNPKGILLNAARGDVVDEGALVNSPHIRNYCTDVFSNEPLLNHRLLQDCKLATPHIAGHTIEGKMNAVINLARQIHILYQLPFTLSEQNPFSAPVIDPRQPDWAEQIRQYYHPESDSLALKQSLAIAQDFKTLRAAHNFRHNLLWKSARHPG
ncbi:MAG: 4-phosphoerythronate dehydrogenase [Legionellaceae bacterium]|nr:4-phosphoerythronate dehydrogenase [Legionellaceae bacterium]